MKTRFKLFMLAMMAICSIPSFASVGDSLTIIPVELTVSYDGNKDEPTRPHSPVQKPQIMFDGHTLYLISGCDNTTIVLRNEDEQIVYTEFVTPWTESVELSENLSGTYELRIIRGSITFVGKIDI